MKKIELTHDQVAIVDNEDYDWLNKWKWRAVLNNKTQFHAVRTTISKVTKKPYNIAMQRHILGLERKDRKIVKHKNGKTLDNRRSNLIIRKRLPAISNKKICGIYKITNPKGKIYIGQAVDCNNRKNHYQIGHCEKQLKLYNSIKKYGWDNKHKFEVIEECDKGQLDDLEIYYIKLFNCFNTKHGLNLKTGGQFGSRVIKWTKKECKKSAKLFDSITLWKKAHSAAYQTARKEGWRDECCAHMKKKFHKYDGKSYEYMLDYVKLLKERYGWKKRRDWRDKDEVSYDYTVKVGFNDRIVKELNLFALKMRTDYELITIGRQYNSPREWENNDRTSFRAAELRGLKDAFRHMANFKGFTNKGYVIKIRPYSIDDSFSLD